MWNLLPVRSAILLNPHKIPSAAWLVLMWQDDSMESCLFILLVNFSVQSLAVFILSCSPTHFTVRKLSSATAMNLPDLVSVSFRAHDTCFRVIPPSVLLVAFVTCAFTEALAMLLLHLTTPSPLLQRDPTGISEPLLLLTIIKIIYFGIKMWCVHSLL